MEPRKKIRGLIDNKSLLEPGHSVRFKEDIRYGMDYVLVPKYVFKALSVWYKCNIPIERKVTQHENWTNQRARNISVDKSPYVSNNQQALKKGPYDSGTT